ncbi:acyl-CoA dehydrogenase [Pseudopedobacter beijingensis]|uniref:Acyl-CoA dehydrogenase n=1 Tax=Pseudopedobacter beijingensis TaxID=1207056 RepID=A0ABW4IKC6_9SPHI
MSFEQSWTTKIRKYAAESETLGKLHPEILNLIYEQNWFNLYVPKIYGGLEKPLSEILRLEENLAKADGSLAWTVTLCSGAAWFAGFLDPQLAIDIFSDSKVCFAGSGATGGTAIETDNGYLINGFWKYASGALHATIFTANCTLCDKNGNPLLNNDEKEIVKSFILKREEVEIIPEWSYIGLAATGSHAFKTKDLVVGKNRLFEINSALNVECPLLNYPFMALAETTLAVNHSGMALHFIELVEEYFYQRSGLKRYTPEQVSYFEKDLHNLKANFKAVRKAFYNTFDSSWKQFKETGIVNDDLLKQVSKKSRSLAHRARKTVDALYPYCGLEAAKKESELNRVWRDLHTASQHSLLTFEF